MDFDYLDEIKIQRPSKFASKTLKEVSSETHAEKNILVEQTDFTSQNTLVEQTNFAKQSDFAKQTNFAKQNISAKEKTVLNKTISKTESLKPLEKQNVLSDSKKDNLITVTKESIEQEETFSESDFILHKNVLHKNNLKVLSVSEAQDSFSKSEPLQNYTEKQIEELTNKTEQNNLEQEQKQKIPKKYKEAKIPTRNLHNKVIVRYICRELFLYFIVSFGFFFVAFFVNQILLLAETILRQRVPVSSTIKLITYCLPGIVAQSAPFATLVGFLMCLGRMATDNEILVLRASGYRYFSILRPVIIMGIVISVFSFVMNDYFLPLGVLNYNKLRRQIISTDPAVEIESNSVRRMNNTMLVIGDVTENNITDLVFFDTNQEGKERIIVTRNSEVRQSDSSGILMQFDMNNVTALMLDRTNRKNFDVLESQKAQLNIFDSVLQDYDTELAPREMTSFDLWKKIKELKSNPDVSLKRINSYNVEFYKKFSMPFGSIFFAILAFPLALIFGKRDGQTLGFIFGIIISVLYWAATILGQLFGIRSGWNGFWMMWGPNIFLGLLGIILYTKLRKK